MFSRFEVKPRQRKNESDTADRKGFQTLPNYNGMPLTEAQYFDVEFASKTIANLTRGKAADIESISAEHLQYCHSCLPVP